MKTPNGNYGMRKYLLALVSLMIVIGANQIVSATTFKVMVHDYSFNPKSISAQVGDTVLWLWTDGHSHSTTCHENLTGTFLPSGAEPWDAQLNEESPKFSYILTKSGSYRYASKSYYNIGMTGTINVGILLPVELTEFVATTIKNEVILDWSTGGEFNNDRFDVQRVEVAEVTDYNPNELQFYTVGSISGNGTSNNSHHYRFIDKDLRSGKYLYRLMQVDYNSNYMFHLLPDEINIGVPEKLVIFQNFPNPFNPVTKINFDLPEYGHVRLNVFDINGRKVMSLIDGYMPGGYQGISVDGSSLSSGMYYYRFSFDSDNIHKVFTKKMMLLK